jgi:hypothetical protein
LDGKSGLWRARDAADRVAFGHQRVGKKFANATAAAGDDEIHRR